MIKKIPCEKMGESNLDWLKSKLHFSFADYYNEKNINFGVLRILNDNIIISNKGFLPHSHRDMEIISYVVNGQVLHKDSIGNEVLLERGHVQYLSAGKGVSHSEINTGNEELRLLQIWILPNKLNHNPIYKSHKFNWEERKDKFLYLVSNINGEAPIKINQDVNIYAIELSTDKITEFPIKKGRQAYIVQIEGNSLINDNLELKERDGLEVIGESIKIKSLKNSHIIIIEMFERMDLK